MWGMGGSEASSPAGPVAQSTEVGFYSRSNGKALKALPRKTARSWGCSSVVERVLSMYEVPGSIPGTSTSFERNVFVIKPLFLSSRNRVSSFSFLSVLPMWYPVSAPRVLPPPGMSKRF